MLALRQCTALSWSSPGPDLAFPTWGGRKKWYVGTFISRRIPVDLFFLQNSSRFFLQNPSTFFVDFFCRILVDFLQIFFVEFQQIFLQIFSRILVDFLQIFCRILVDSLQIVLQNSSRLNSEKENTQKTPTPDLWHCSECRCFAWHHVWWGSQGIQGGIFPSLPMPRSGPDEAEETGGQGEAGDGWQ